MLRFAFEIFWHEKKWRKKNSLNFNGSRELNPNRIKLNRIASHSQQLCITLMPNTWKVMIKRKKFSVNTNPFVAYEIHIMNALACQHRHTPAHDRSHISHLCLAQFSKEKHTCIVRICNEFMHWKSCREPIFSSRICPTQWRRRSFASTLASDRDQQNWIKFTFPMVQMHFVMVCTATPEWF